MALKYTTVQGFWKFLGINEDIEDYQPSDVSDGAVTTVETVKASPVSAGSYYLKQKGVNEDTLVLYAATAPLTITTDYTFDSDKSKVTITSTGATALTGVDLTARYEYSSFGKDLNYNETLSILEAAENKVEDETNVAFANQSASAPSYVQITGEKHPGKGGCDNLYQVQKFPVVKLQTTVNGAYTTGGTEITLADATGFPTTGTIYIGGNKVTYSDLTGSILTVLSSTPSIDDGAIVRGEVVEISTSPSGVDPTFTVLTPDSDYSIDYDTGAIQLMDEYYFATDTYLDKPQDGVNDRMRLYYNHAWHELGQDATIPNELAEIIYMIAGRQVAQRTVLKAITGQRDNFNPQSFGFSKLDVSERLASYRMIRNSNV